MTTKTLRFTFLSFCVACIAIATISCRTQLETEKPAKTYNPLIYEPEISQLSIPVELKVKDLEALINSKLTGLLYADTSLTDNGGDNLMVKAWKKENFSLDFNNGQFVYRIPLKLWVKAGWKVERFGIALSDYRELNAEIALKFRSTISVDKNWKIITKTTSDGYEWLSKPTLKIGPVDVPITFITDKILKSNLDLLTSSIDKGINTGFDLKAIASSAWKAIQEPMLINDEYKLWLRITPKAFINTPFTGGNGIIRYNPSMKVIAECFTGTKPIVKPNNNLPELQQATTNNEEFILNINTYISYQYIDSITRKTINGSTYNFGKRSITINNSEIYGNENNMIISTALSGSLNGVFYFAGTPIFSTADSSLTLQNLDFHIKTKNILIKSASWIANSGIEKILERKMIFPIGSNIKSTYDILQQSLEKFDISDGFYISGSLKGFEVQQPSLVVAGIVAPIAIKGKLQVKLSNPSNKK